MGGVLDSEVAKEKFDLFCSLTLWLVFRVTMTKNKVHPAGDNSSPTKNIPKHILILDIR